MCGVFILLFYDYAFHAHCFGFVILLHDINNKITDFEQKHRK